MLTASKEKPSVVMIVVSLEDNSTPSETRYISGKTVAEVVAELFGEKPVKVRKQRKPRAPKVALPTGLEDQSATQEPEKKKRGKGWPTD